MLPPVLLVVALELQLDIKEKQSWRPPAPLPLLPGHLWGGWVWSRRFPGAQLTSTHRELRVWGCADGCGAGPWDAEGHHPAATTHGAGVGAAAGTRRVGIQVHLGAEIAGTAPEPHCNKAVRGVQFGTWSTLPQFPHLCNGGSAGG